jgi:hypothetical protein
MLQRLTAQLPDWAQPNHPAMRHTLGLTSRPSRRTAILRLLVVVLLIVLAGVLLIPTFIGVTATATTQPLSEIVLNIVYWPTVVLQLALSALVIIYTSSVIGDEKRRQTWDTLRTTRNGVGLALRARWSAAIFYRMSGFLILLFVVRLVLVGLLLYDLTAFGGDYLAIISGPATPQLPVAIVVGLLALSITASFILPLTGVSLDAALGLLLSTFVQQRVFLVLTQVIVILARIALSFAMFAAMLYATDIITMPSTFTGLLSMAGFGAFGDWGLRYLNLAFYSDLWGMVQYSIFMGVGLIIAAFLQMGLAELIVLLAIRRGENVQ